MGFFLTFFHLHKKIIYYIFCIPKPISWPSKLLADNDFIDRLTRFFLNAILYIVVFLYSMISLIQWYFLSICFALLWLLISTELTTALLLSRYKAIEWLMAGTKSIKIFWSHTTALSASHATKYYSATMVELAKQLWYTLL